MNRDRPNFTIRPAVIDDVAVLAAVHLKSWLATYRGLIADDYLDQLTQKTFEGYHRPRFDEHGSADSAQPFVVACDETGEVIGFARGGAMREKSPTGDALPDDIVGRYSAELYAIYLLPQHLGQGVGLALFRELVQRLIELNHASMCVWVLNNNALGRRFYERMGGRVIECESRVTLGGVGYPHIAYGWEALIA